MLTLLNDNVADKSPVDWKIGRKELVAARHEDIWYRAMAVKKSGASFHCFLLDFGGLVHVAQDNLRPLNEAFYQLPPYAYQVCLAGFGPEEGTQFTQEHAAILREFFTADPDYKFVAKFLGQAEGGRWLVDLRGKDDGESVADLLIEGGMGVARKDDIAVTMEKFLEQEARTGGDDQDTSTTSTEVEVIHATAAPAVIKAADASTAPPSPVTGPVVPRGSVKPGSNDECAGVCYFTSPDLFYTSPLTLLTCSLPFSPLVRMLLLDQSTQCLGPAAWLWTRDPSGTEQRYWSSPPTRPASSSTSLTMARRLRVPSSS